MDHRHSTRVSGGWGTVGWRRWLTWCDEILDTVSIPTETSHVNGEHPVGTVPAGRGRGRGGAVVERGVGCKQWSSHPYTHMHRYTPPFITTVSGIGVVCCVCSTGVHSASLCDDCLAGHKSFDHRGMAVLSGQVQGSVSFLILNIDTGTLFGGEGGRCKVRRKLQLKRIELAN